MTNLQFSKLKVVLCKLLALGVFAGCSICQPAGGQTIPFANYVRFVPSGPGTLNQLFEEGPFPPTSSLPTPVDPPLPGWDANALATVSSAGGPPTLNETTLIATLPVLDTTISVARDAVGKELGRLELLGVGTQKLDLNANNAIVDETSGTIAVQFGGSLLDGQPAVDLSVVSASGIYASDIHPLDIGMFGFAGGKFLLVLDDDPATSLQDNILNAFNGGQIAGVDVAGVWTGQYVPEPSAMLLLALGSAIAVDLRRRRTRSAVP